MNAAPPRVIPPRTLFKEGEKQKLKRARRRRWPRWGHADKPGNERPEPNAEATTAATKTDRPRCMQSFKTGHRAELWRVNPVTSQGSPNPVEPTRQT